MEDYFAAALALDERTNNVVPGATADVYALSDTSFSTPLALTDLTDMPMASLIAGPNGIYPAFKVTTGETMVMAKSGDVVTPMTSQIGRQGEPGEPGYGVPDLSTGEPGQVVTHSGSAAVWSNPTGGDGSGSGIIGAPAQWPSTFPPSAHSHPASQISDSTPVGRSLMTAVDAQAARAAISAAPSSVVSFPGFGGTADKAAPGNHSHGASSVVVNPVSGVPATNVQDAIEQLAAMASGGGTGGSSGIRLVIYKSGAYPAQPTDPPAGTLVRFFFGPSPYQGPSWPGVVDIHFRAELT